MINSLIDVDGGCDCYSGKLRRLANITINECDEVGDTAAWERRVGKGVTTWVVYRRVRWGPRRFPVAMSTRELH